MQTEMTPPIPTSGSPTPPSARIEALDVVRGFALIGIFLMNIEWFNRSSSGIGLGMPLGLTGIDWFASWFIAYFIQGKFWTIFSLLFGMGFAVMLKRADQAGRPFMVSYLRRILGLAIFGAAHYIFLWNGDILFSYSVGAIALLILLYGEWKKILTAMAVLVGIGFIPGADSAFGLAGVLAFILLQTVFLRVERKVGFGERKLPVFAMVLLVLGTVGLIAAIVFWVLPNGPKEPRVPVTVLSITMLFFSVLSAKFHDPKNLRELRLGVGIYSFSFLMAIIFGAIQYLKPPESAKPPAAVATTAATPKLAAASEITKPAADSSAAARAPQPVASAASEPAAVAKSADAKTDKKPELTDAEKAAKKKADRAKRLAEREAEIQHETRILSSGTYLEAVEIRARKFPGKVLEDAGFGTVLAAMFLLGSWFVRSGIMDNTAAHLPLFRKLALYGLPIGIGMGLAGSLIAVSHIPGDDYDGFQLARGLAMLGNLPACLGYVGLVVVMLHSNTVFSKIRVLAPAGRMALTTYLTQSVICSLVFFGYGLGYWGLDRAWQVVFVAVVFTIQLAFSRWWLARYRFGPLEWVWRAFTYRESPAMRR